MYLKNRKIDKTDRFGLFSYPNALRDVYHQLWVFVESNEHTIVGLSEINNSLDKF